MAQRVFLNKSERERERERVHSFGGFECTPTVYVVAFFSAYDSKSGVYHIRGVVSCILFCFASSFCHGCCHATRVIGSRL